jgi:hypothetical protein
MAGRTKDSGNRQDAGSLRSASAGFLLNRLLYLINHINTSLGLIGINRRQGSFDCFSLVVDDEIALRQEISEFLGMLFYMQKKYNALLIPHRAKIIRLKNKLGIYFA